MRGASACSQQVVAGAPQEEWAAPAGVVARSGNVLARNPDCVAIDRRCTVITPPGPRWVAHLRLVAGKAIVSRRAGRRDVHVARACDRVDGRIRGTRVIRRAHQ